MRIIAFITEMVIREILGHLGELAIVGGWLLVVAGSDYAQRGAFAALPWQAGSGYALLAANPLYINQFPDATADVAAGKRTLVVRLGRRRARLGFIVIAALSALCVSLGVACAVLPAPRAICSPRYKGIS
jgi:1,4-dihydroxy-2-naphthoate octaprenyltransferase